MSDSQALLDQAMEIMRRDLGHMATDSLTKKLKPAWSKDLVSYLKLLNELSYLEKDQNKRLARSSEADLKALARTLIDEPSP